MHVLSLGIRRIKQFIKKIVFDLSALTRFCRYLAAKARYRLAGHFYKPVFSHPREIGLIKIDPYNNDTIIKLPSDYMRLVDLIGEGIHKKMALARNCVYYLEDKEAKRRLDTGEGMPESTWDLPEFRGGDIATIRSKECHDIDGIEELCQKVMPEVEKYIYGSYVEVASSFSEMKFVTKKMILKGGLFHSDRHYEDTIRMIIYMCDVSEDNAPFEYLRHKETKKTCRIKTADHPLYTKNGRIPEELLQNYLNQGYERVKVTGKKGTIILFDSKIIHKANAPKNGTRVVLILPIRPALGKSVRYVDPANIEGVYV